MENILKIGREAEYETAKSCQVINTLAFMRTVAVIAPQNCSRKILEGVESQ
jgi:hypothetical protein